MSVNSYKIDEKSEKVSKRNTLLRLYKYMLEYRWQIVVVIVIMFITIGITVYNPLLIEMAIDDYIKKSDISGLIKIGMFGIGINIIFAVLVKIRMYFMAKMSNEILLTVRQELYTHIQKLSFNFFDSRPIGKILSRIMGDVNSLKNLLTESVTSLIPNFFTLVAVLAIMFVRDYRLALASLISLPILLIFTMFVQSKAHKLWQSFFKKISNMNAFVHEYLSGIRVVKSFTAENELEKEFVKTHGEINNSFILACAIGNSVWHSIDICWMLGLASLYFTGINIIGIDNISVGTLIAFSTYLAMFWSPLISLSNFYNNLVTNIAGAERIFEVLDIKPEIEDSIDAYKMPEIDGNVEFRNVTFAYDDLNDVLNDVSFYINSGETVALVGPTGAGKTTIINLLSRFYEVESGGIYIDGHDVRNITLESLRSQLGIMTQENFLFSGTIRENIRYGRLDATDDEVEKAAKAVNAHEFIMKTEKGYDTELKEKGNGLSIGQRQLLALARTMVSDPRILILDEATSSIDTHTEILVQKGIEELLKDRTSFIIAHRLSTIQKADRIFVIDNYGIEEEGTIEELLEKKGVYYNMHMAQFKNI